MAARRSEDDRWREEAHDALRKLSKAMDFFLQVSSLLVGLTEEHRPNDFSHCEADGQPWPCKTMTVVQKIGTGFRELQESTT